MSIHLFQAASLIACSAVMVLGQDFPAEREPVASSVSASRQEGQDTVAAIAANPKTVAYCNQCTGFSASTGNLYFTSFYRDEFGPDSASFYRTSKNGPAGSEGLVYQESQPGIGSFGRPVWASVNGVYYGYFSASYNNSGVHTYQLKRVPLGGGGAVILAYLPSFITSLATDGSRLFWSDSIGIRSMPMGGGLMQTLLSASGPIRFVLGGNYIYYSTGFDINRLPKTGGAPAPVAKAPNFVTALYVNADTAIFWGEQGGAVRSLGAGGIQTHQVSASGRSATSVGFDGTRVLWIECTQPGYSSCSVKTKTGSSPPVTVFNGGTAGNLQWDASSMYWSDVASIKKYLH